MTEVVMLSVSVLSFMIAGALLSATLGRAEAKAQGAAPRGVMRGGGIPR